MIYSPFVHPTVTIAVALVLLAVILTVVACCAPRARVAAVLVGAAFAAYLVHRVKDDASAWASVADMINAKTRCARGREIIESMRENAAASNWVSVSRQLDLAYENACPIFHPDTNASEKVEEIVRLGPEKKPTIESTRTLVPRRPTDVEGSSERGPSAGDS